MPSPAAPEILTSPDARTVALPVPVEIELMPLSPPLTFPATVTSALPLPANMEARMASLFAPDTSAPAVVVMLTLPPNPKS